MLKESFAELGLSEPSYQVFTTLLEYGPSSAKQISERLGINRPSTYDYLKLLINKGLVIERHEDTKNSFQVDDPKQLTATLKVLSAGRYVVKYRVLSVDGHVVQDQFPFTVKQ